MAKLAVRVLLAVVIAATTAIFLPYSGMRPAIAQVVDPVIIRSGLHSGYGRIVLQWSKPVNYNAEIIGDQLVVRFDQPLVASLRGVLAPVSKYISDGFFDPDGQTVAFVLSDDYEVRAFNVGSNVVLDILDKPQPTPAAPAPTPTQRPTAPPPATDQAAQTPQITPAPISPVEIVADENPAQDLATLDVRVGRHPTFYRLVFDWPNRTDYALEGEQGAQTIAFAGPARIDAAGISRRLPEGVRIRQGETRPLDVVIETTPARPLRHFRSGNKVVVDIMGAQRAPATSSAETRPTTTPNRQTTSNGVSAPATPSAPPAPAAPAAAPVESAEVGQQAADTNLDPNSPEAIAQNAAEATGVVSENGEGARSERIDVGDLQVTVDQTATELSLGFRLVSRAGQRFGRVPGSFGWPSMCARPLILIQSDRKLPRSLG